tara:strand:- start:29 stop:223 length:195 start_codon:yes stop_codon:yes gene_type:complete
MKEKKTDIVDNKTRKDVLSGLHFFLQKHPDIKRCYVRYEGGWILSNLSKPENTTNEELNLDLDV